MEVLSMSRHRAMCTLAYTPVQLFDLAADVERYPEFLPGYFATRVTERDGNVYFSDQIVGFGTFRKRFVSRTVLSRPGRIDVTSTDRLFRTFNLVWHFDALPDDGSLVTLEVELELRSRLARGMFSRIIDRTVGDVVSAFEARADQLYGPRAYPDALQ
jgi:coenzyme Q-binding protein COQ10